MKYIKYLSYVLRHKWYVFLAASDLGIMKRGLFHDLSKFLPSEFFPYMNYFYSKDKVEGGYYKPNKTEDSEFDYAWLLHQRRNKHHWQFWVLPKDDGGLDVFEMPLKYRKEMLADWIGAGKAQGNNDLVSWYLQNRNKIKLGPETRRWIEDRLEEI